MQHYHALQLAHASKSWLTIGAFDGVHAGHQQIVRQLVAGAHAEAAPAVVLTFEPHPAEVLHGPLKNFYLHDPEDKAALFAELGVDILISQPFDASLRNTSAEEFMRQVHQQLQLSQLWIGHDFALGRDRQGNFDALRRFGAELGYSVHQVLPVRVDGAVVSSSMVRTALAEGDVTTAERLLGRRYRLRGEVVSGAQRGRTIGIPTANVQVPERRLVPASGVYVTWATLAGARWPSVTNIGVRPTFADGTPAPVVETHILDYSGGEFYGQALELEFVARLRGEQKFAGVDELVRQIHLDIEQARNTLS
ncbi:MAG: bifunctional riboflavin kinase/FAD synthetase [Anaerolineales bacterium]|nr:bifunctional riboflavin kinase/FAD synthetase [Anaerolineales bacterium]